MSSIIPFELMYGLIVDAVVNGSVQRFIVDTGASHTVLTAKAAAARAQCLTLDPVTSVQV